MTKQTARQEPRVGVGTRFALDAVGFFERQAHRVWNSELTADEKALRLYTLGDTVAKYASQFSGDAAGDLWSELIRKRRKADLTRLSEDICLLAIAATHTSAAAQSQKGDFNE